PHLDTARYLIRGGSALVHIYTKERNDRRSLNKLYKELKDNAKNYKVYKAAKLPRSWHYRPKDNKDGSIGDILLVPYPPFSFSFGGRKALGAHGFDNRLPEMQA